MSKNEFCNKCDNDSRTAKTFTWFVDKMYCSPVCGELIKAVKAKRERDAKDKERENFERYGRKHENWSL